MNARLLFDNKCKGKGCNGKLWVGNVVFLQQRIRNTAPTSFRRYEERFAYSARSPKTTYVPTVPVVVK